MKSTGRSIPITLTQDQYIALVESTSTLYEFQNLLIEMMDYYKIGGFDINSGEYIPSAREFGNMLRDVIEQYIDDQIEQSVECASVDEDLLADVEHLLAYTDHLVEFSKLPCLPKDLENLRDSNLKLAIENEKLKNEIIGWKNKWDVAIQMAAEAENKLEAIRAFC